MQALLHGKYYCVAIKQVVIASKHYCMYSNACEKISKYERLIYLSPLPVSVVDTRRRTIRQSLVPTSRQGSCRLCPRNEAQ